MNVVSQVLPDVDILECALEAARVGLIVVDSAGVVLRVNRRLGEMLGYEPHELPGAPWTFAFPGEILPRSERYLKALLANSPRVTSRWSARRRDGSLVATLAGFRGIDLPGHGRVAVIALSEIGQRTLDEEAHAEEVRRLTEMFEATSEVFRLVESDTGRLLYVSPSYRDIWGRSVESAYADPGSLLEAVHPDDRTQMAAALAPRSADDYDVEYRIVRPDGSQRWVRERGRAQHDARVRAGRVASVSTDVTVERQALEQARELADELEARVQARTADLTEKVAALESARNALASSEEQLRNVVQNVREGIAVFQDDAIVFCNPRLGELVGLPAEQLIGRALAEFIHPDDIPVVIARHRQRLGGDAPPSQYSFRVVHRDGGVIWVEISVALITWKGRPAALGNLTDISARRGGEQALARSEQQYRTVVDNVGEGILIVQDAAVVFANPSVQRITGYAQDELLGRPFLEFVHPDDRALSKERYLRRSRGEPAPSHVAFRLLARDGRVIWIELSVVIIEWEGRPATLSFMIDTTASRELQENLRRTLEERETLLDNAILGIVFLDANGRLRWGNRAAELMLRTDLTKFVGRSVETFYSSRQEYEEIGYDVRQAVASGGSYQRELRMRRGDGSLFWVYCSGKAASASDISQGTIWALMDIDARKQLEEQLHRSSSEREAMLENTLVGVMYARDRRCEWVNRKFGELTGYRPEELIGRTSAIHFADEADFERFYRFTYPVLSQGRPLSTEWQLRRRDGSSFWAQVYGKSVDPSDLSRGVIWTCLDISEQHQAREDTRLALEKERDLNELKSRFVSMTSHEFRTPLAAILSSAELLRDYGDRFPASERAELIAIVESSVRRMSRMLENILTIGRSDAGRLDFAPASVDVQQLCEALVQDARRAAGDPASTVAPVRITLAGPTASRMLDERLVRHILGNLLSNALKYSPGAEEVGLHVDCLPQRTVFTVTDRGIGIPPEDLPRLFDTFHRAGNVGNIAGTGLGMTIVKRSVERHGGSIEVHSRVGEGSRFVVSLPQA